MRSAPPLLLDFLPRKVFGVGSRQPLVKLKDCRAFLERSPLAAFFRKMFDPPTWVELNRHRVSLAPEGEQAADGSEIPSNLKKLRTIKLVMERSTVQSCLAAPFTLNPETFVRFSRRPFAAINAGGR